MKTDFLLSVLILVTVISQINCQVFLRSVQKNRKRVVSSTTTTSTTPEPPAKPLIEEGKYYTIVNGPSEKYLAVEGANFSRNANVVAASWTGEDNQIWIALHSKPTNSLHSGRFVLIPKRQVYSKPNEHVSYTLNSLPKTTEVLTLESITGNLTTEVYQPGVSSQEWIIQDGKNGIMFIKNLGNNQCIKNFEYYIYNNLYSVLYESYKPDNIFQKIASFISRLRKPYKPKPGPNPLSTLDCSSSDITQIWIPELVKQSSSS